MYAHFENKLASREKILQDNSPNKINLVALEGSRIIGFCNAGPSFILSPDYLGEIYAIYLLNGFKGSGIGKRLLLAATIHLKQESLLPYS